MLNLRLATEQDVPLLVQLIRELAEYERAPQEAVATPDDIRRDGFSNPPRFQVVIAEWGGEPAGFALFFHNYSTWTGRPGLYIEDLFVRPPFRGRGIGKALMARLANIAVARECARMEWLVLDWNAPAIGFYRSFGAELMDGWLTMRVWGEALRKLADGQGHQGESTPGSVSRESGPDGV
jgi:GNAT superfamily N-acetyltransferase